MLSLHVFVIPNSTYLEVIFSDLSSQSRLSPLLLLCHIGIANTLILTIGSLPIRTNHHCNASTVFYIFTDIFQFQNMLNL